MGLLRAVKSILPLVLSLALTLPSFAQQAVVPQAEASPVGYWQTFDDEQDGARSIVKIFSYQGKLYGRIMQVNYRPGEGPADVCSKCSDTRKNQPILGLVIMSGLVPDRDAPNEWSDGQIVDPNNGHVYSSQLTLINHGKTLNMLGYMGTKLLGRTQTWQRVSDTVLTTFPSNTVATGSDTVAVQNQLSA